MTNKKNALFSGTVTEIITPFTPSGAIDIDMLSNQVNYMIDNGMEGVYVNGLASEALMMSDEDRLAAAKTVVNSSKGRMPVMANIIVNSLNEGIKCAKLYADLGADAIAITNPLVYKYTNDGFFEFFNTIANATDLPAYIYNEPSTGNKLSPDLVAKLFAANEKFKGYKDSTQNIIEQQTLIGLIGDGRHFELLAGCDAQITTTMMLGGLGAISLISTVFPKLIMDVVKPAEIGDWEASIAAQAKVLKVRSALKIGPFMAAYKHAAGKIGLPMGKMKAPLSELGSADIEKVDAALSALGMY
jgi:dihydrodipicolinate synthase/N-acetylneuraminate lyase